MLVKAINNNSPENKTLATTEDIHSMPIARHRRSTISNHQLTYSEVPIITHKTRDMRIATSHDPQHLSPPLWPADTQQQPQLRSPHAIIPTEQATDLTQLRKPTNSDAQSHHATCHAPPPTSQLQGSHKRTYPNNATINIDNSRQTRQCHTTTPYTYTIFYYLPCATQTKPSPFKSQPQPQVATSNHPPHHIPHHRYTKATY